MIILASLLAILALTGLCWAMGFRAAPALDEPGATAEAEARLAGFRATNVLLASEGRGAVLRGLDGSIGLLLPLGDGWVARRLVPQAIRCIDGRLTARLGEPMLRDAQLVVPACPAWLEVSR